MYLELRLMDRITVLVLDLIIKYLYEPCADREVIVFIFALAIIRPFGFVIKCRIWAECAMQLLVFVLSLHFR